MNNLRLCVGSCGSENGTQAFYSLESQDKSVEICKPIPEDRYFAMRDTGGGTGPEI